MKKILNTTNLEIQRKYKQRLSSANLEIQKKYKTNIKHNKPSNSEEA